MPASVNVGIVGLGTIGTGVLKLMEAQRSELEQRLGFPLRIKWVADIDLKTDRGVSLDAYQTTQDWKDIIGDPETQVVIELIGGTGIAREVVLAAIRAGKSVVTANKALLAHHGPELYDAAAEHGVDISFEASVGGTIPVLRALREGLSADRLHSIWGIVNGTCNFILTQMEANGEDYAVCLKRAQDLGYAEADPAFDVDGTDSAHKLCILLGLGFGCRVKLEEISASGIETLSATDIEYAARFGLRIKLLAIAKATDAGLEARVHPTMIPADSLLAGVDGSMNAVEVRGEFSGPTLYYGAGAGSLPTASAVVADVMEQARALVSGSTGRVPPLGRPQLRETALRNAADIEGEYYLRFTAPDRPGVLAAITGALGEQGISIASVMQPERHELEAVPVVIVTHPAKHAALNAALQRIHQQGDVSGRTQVIRIEREL